VGTTTITAQALARRAAQAKRAADGGPVVITRRGAPTHVLLTYADYERLQMRGMSAAEALAGPPEFDFEFDPPRLRDDVIPPVEFD
jgi:prevent-host-death family protein